MPIARKNKFIGISVSQYGALGDGSTNDHVAINAALANNPYVKLEANKTYNIGAGIVVPSNTRFDFNGSKLVRKFATGLALYNTNYLASSLTDTNITVENVWLEDDGDPAHRGVFAAFSGITGLKILGYKELCTSTGAGGASGLYVSCKNGLITRLDINSVTGAVRADGLHCGYLENVSIVQNLINTGDDAIALHFQAPDLVPHVGPQLVSKYVYVGDNVLQSAQSNNIRIGAWGADSATGNGHPSSSTSSWTSLTIGPNTHGPAGNNCIQLQDTRAGAEIVTPNTDIVIEAQNFGSQSSAPNRLINIEGNKLITDNANYLQKNWTNVKIHGCTGTQFGSQLIRVGGITNLTIDSAGLTMDSSVVASNAQNEYHQITNLLIRDSKFTTTTSGTSCILEYINTAVINNTSMEGASSTNGYLWRLNTDFASTLRMSGGRILAGTTGIHYANSGSITEFNVSGTIFNASTKTTILSSAATTYNFLPADLSSLDSREFTNAISNGNFERGSVNYILNGWTIGNDPTNAYVGNNVATNTAIGVQLLRNSINYPCAPGDLIYGEGWVKTDAGFVGTVLRFELQFFDKDGALISASAGNNTTAVQLTFVKSSVAATAPASAAYYTGQVRSSITAGTVWVDSLYANKQINTGFIGRIDIFTANGTWTKQPWARTVAVQMRGGGGGGGAGRRGLVATGRSGGQGGYATANATGQCDASVLPATVAITVGAKGTGGAAQTVDSTDGAAGTAGIDSTFGTYLRARGGLGGLGGTNAAVGVQTTTPTAGIVAPLATSITAVLTNLTSVNAGGSGGSVAAGNTALAGANGGPATANDPGGFSQGALGATATNGTDGTLVSADFITFFSTTTPLTVGPVNAVLGGGGGGGGASTDGVTAAGKGGNGGGYGSGGGGGGASTNGSNSGAGGDGSPGWVAVVQTP